MVPKTNAKSPFLDIVGLKGQIWTVFGQNGENEQKRGCNIFPNFLNPIFI